MKGWVYVITTKSMPGVLKVGFTLKDPVMRAKELGRTGLPHPYVVEFEMLVERPRIAERRIHALMEDVREGGEWFRCSVEEATSKIREVVGSGAIFEKSRVSVDEHAVSKKSIEETRALRSNSSEAEKQGSFRRTATYEGVCHHCRSIFSVTLTRYDSGARCPNCFKLNDTAEFERQNFII